MTAQLRFGKKRNCSLIHSAGVRISFLRIFTICSYLFYALAEGVFEPVGYKKVVVKITKTES